MNLSKFDGNDDVIQIEILLTSKQIFQTFIFNGRMNIEKYLGGDPKVTL